MDRDRQAYTLPGVMRFLQAEWQRSERERIRWGIESAEMRSRIATLEAENRSLRRAASSHERHASLLRARLGHSDTSLEDSDVIDDSPAAAEKAGDEVARYTAEIRSILESCGLVPDELPTQPPLDSGQADGPELKATLTGFGQICSTGRISAVADQLDGTKKIGVSDAASRLFAVGLAPDLIVLAAGGLYVYREDGTLKRHLVEDLDAITAVVYDDTAKQLIVGTESSLHRFAVKGNQQPAELESARNINGSTISSATKNGSLNTKPLINGTSTTPKDPLDSMDPMNPKELKDPKDFSEPSISPESQESQESGLDSDAEIDPDNPKPIESKGLGFTNDDSILIHKGSEHLPVAAVAVQRGLVAAASTHDIWIWDKEHDADSNTVTKAPIANVIQLAFVDNLGEAVLIAAPHTGGAIVVVDPYAGREIRRIVLPAEAGIVTAINPLVGDDPCVALGFSSGSLAIIDLRKDFVAAFSANAHPASINGVMPVSTSVLASTGADGRVSLWTLPNLAWRGRLLSHDPSGGGCFGGTWPADKLGAHKKANGVHSPATLATVGSDGVARIYKFT